MRGNAVSLVMLRAAAVCAATAAGVSQGRAEQTQLRYAAPDGGPVFTITENGLSSVHLGNTRVAGGRLACLPCFQMEKFLPVRGKSITVLSDRAAEVVHEYDVATVRCRYALDGEDVVVRVRLDNRHPSRTMPFILVEMPDFARFEIRAQRHTLPRARHNRRSQAAYVVSDSHSIGISPDDVGLCNVAAWWAGRQGGMQKDANPQRARVMVGMPVRPGSARTATVGIRVSATADWRRALGHYRDVIHRRFGERPRYEEADHRPIIQMVMSKSPKYASHRNPYATHDRRQIHTPALTQQLVTHWTPSFVRAHCQGVLVWGQQGSHARGCMYRPDCDVLPPEHRDNFPRLAAMLKKEGLWLGATARPAEEAVPRNLTQDWTYRNNVDDPAALDMMARRLVKLVELGASAFYLDCLGLNNFDDFKRMRRFRELLGPEVQTYSEYGSDAFVALSGIYLHCHEWDGERGRPKIMWTNHADLELLQWVYPRGTLICKLAVKTELYPKAVEWLLAHRITPLLEDYKVRNNPEVVESVRASVEKYLTPEGRWK